MINIALFSLWLKAVVSWPINSVKINKKKLIWKKPSCFPLKLSLGRILKFYTIVLHCLQTIFLLIIIENKINQICYTEEIFLQLTTLKHLKQLIISVMVYKDVFISPQSPPRFQSLFTMRKKSFISFVYNFFWHKKMKLWTPSSFLS